MHLAISHTYLNVLINVEIMEKILFKRYHEIKFTNADQLTYNTNKALFLGFDNCNICVLWVMGAQ